MSVYDDHIPCLERADFTSAKDYSSFSPFGRTFRLGGPYSCLLSQKWTIGTHSRSMIFSTLVQIIHSTVLYITINSICSNLLPSIKMLALLIQLKSLSLTMSRSGEHPAALKSGSD
jgi:hypothetical protein